MSRLRHIGREPPRRPSQPGSFRHWCFRLVRISGAETWVTGSLCNTIRIIIMMNYLPLAHLLLLLLLTFSSTAAVALEPSSQALARVRQLTASRVGIDSRQNLWIWNRLSGEVHMLSLQGTLLHSTKMDGALAVDAAADWGVVGLSGLGRTLRWLGWNGEKAAQIELADTASDICWLGPTLVAISPQRTPHRVEVWDLEKQQRVRVLGEETAIPVKPGATRLRGVALRYNFARRELVTLDTFTGDLKTFDQAGQVAWSAQVENPDRDSLEKWLQEEDEKARTTGNSQTPLLESLGLALDARGRAWVVQSLTGTPEEGGKIQVAVRHGSSSWSQRSLASRDCLGRNLTFWGDRLIQYRSPGSPWKSCITIREEG